ncbi:ACP S-malonyltransferase [Proteiniclasticum sp. BAD-10]|uniref:Malonyl CoA-acyl carrier protein transacylase n=1 Tax=Proteiniclasticum sediminis TaxID=2804028 RepID=A0A941HQB1_9CLOT|nr:ACP S-malonyltransferase [Proteiniclasticum sediminis]MBR0575293.1 ACP S-malonyltransferase [Proteiniclasticum sediminis]
MKINILFPGQGAQFVGMGLDFYALYPRYREIVDAASAAAKLDLKSVVEDAEKLQETSHAQLAIFTMSYGIASLLQDEGLSFSHTLGLSLGEYGALTLAGALNFEDTVALLKVRSDAMQKASQENPGFLAAVSFLDREKVEEALAGKEGIWISNYNAPNQTVVGGALFAKEIFEESMKAAGAKKVTYLQVSGAFHTALMTSAGERFQEAVQKVPVMMPKVPVLSNLKGDFYQVGDDMASILTQHIYSPVRLDLCLEKLEAKEGDLHLLLGPGKALASILKQNKILGEVLVVNTVEDFEKTMTIIKEKQHEQ